MCALPIFTALWKATDSVSVKLSALYQRAKADGSSEEVRVAGLTAYQQNYILNTGQSSKTTQAYSAVIRADFGGIDFTAVTGYSQVGRASCRERVCQYV